MAVVKSADKELTEAPELARVGAAVLTEHGRLCQVAQRWLRRPFSAGGHGCAVAVTEGWGEGAGEMPDAIGWRRGADAGTVLVEVKVSRADFLADARKPHRQDPARGVGRWRYYLCPEGLVRPDELPPRWGLLYASGRGVIRAIAGPAACLRHHRRGEPVRDAQGNVVWEYEAWSASCQAHAFDERNHDLEAAMLVALLQRVGDAEAANLRLRELRGQVNRLAAQLQRAQTRADGLYWSLFAAHRALEDAGLPIPGSAPTSPAATPRATTPTS